jgi:hypothetical protein
VQNSVKTLGVLNFREAEQNTGKINSENVAQFPGGIAILKLEGTKAATPQRYLTFVQAGPGSLQRMLKSESPVEHAAPALERIVGNRVRRAPDAPLLAWPLACGSTVAARTRALEFSRGVLRVEVPDAGWRAELQHLAPRYLAVINRYAAVPVSRVEFVLRTAK